MDNETIIIVALLIVVALVAWVLKRSKHGEEQGPTDEHVTNPGECAVPDRGIGTVLPSTNVGEDGELAATAAVLRPKPAPRKHTRKQVPKGPGRRQ